MKKINTWLFLTMVITVFYFSSCSKGGGGTVTPPQPTASLTLSLSKSQIAADNFDEVVATIKDQNNNDVTGTTPIYVNGLLNASNKFTTSIIGTYEIKAQKGSSVSSTISVSAVDPGPSPFTQKVYLEDFTGTWCGHCPRVGIQLENYTAGHPNYIVVGVHNADPMQYIYEQQLRSMYAINAFPTVLVDRNIKWNENLTILDNEDNTRAPLGLGFETTVAGNTINVKTKVKYDVTTSFPMKLVVILIEDGLQYNQTNYGYYNLPDPIVNYVHNHVLRAAATDIFGDPIPVAEQTKGNTWEKSHSFNASGYNISKCKIVAFVMYDTNNQSRSGVLNTQIVTAGVNKNFD